MNPKSVWPALLIFSAIIAAPSIRDLHANNPDGRGELVFLFCRASRLSPELSRLDFIKSLAKSGIYLIPRREKESGGEWLVRRSKIISDAKAGFDSMSSWSKLDSQEQIRKLESLMNSGYGAGTFRFANELEFHWRGPVAFCLLTMADDKTRIDSELKTKLRRVQNDWQSQFGRKLSEARQRTSLALYQEILTETFEFQEFLGIRKAEILKLASQCSSKTWKRHHQFALANDLMILNEQDLRIPSQAGKALLYKLLDALRFTDLNSVSLTAKEIQACFQDPGPGLTSSFFAADMQSVSKRQTYVNQDHVDYLSSLFARLEKKGPEMSESQKKLLEEFRNPARNGLPGFPTSYPTERLVTKLEPLLSSLIDKQKEVLVMLLIADYGMPQFVNAVLRKTLTKRQLPLANVFERLDRVARLSSDKYVESIKEKSKLKNEYLGEILDLLSDDQKSVLSRYIGKDLESISKRYGYIQDSRFQRHFRNP